MKIAVIGSGNIATFFSVKLFQAGHCITQVLSKHENNALKLAQKVNAKAETNPMHLDQNAEVYLLAVNDDAIHQYIDHPILKNKLVLYSSGAVSLHEVKEISSQIACLWPVYSIQKENLPDHTEVPLVINHSDAVDSNTILHIANAISKLHYTLSDKQKKTAHLGAVIANNFSNHLFTLSKQMLLNEDIPFDVLLPLIINTTSKLEISPPEKNQSGPAIRHDETTLKHHLELLENNEILKKIYSLLTESIQKYYR